MEVLPLSLEGRGSLKGIQMRSLLPWLVVLGVAAPNVLWAQQATVTVAVPSGALTQLVRGLAPTFQTQTGIAVKVVPAGSETDAGYVSSDAALLPSTAERDLPEQQVAFHGEAILVGSRADRGRVRGLRDIKKALQWIASARGLFVSSSAVLGLREIELKLWDQIGVNVRTRLTWYTDVPGDEAAVFHQAAQFGAYALVQRATWAAQEDRRGLEILVQGDPLMKVAFVSTLIRPQAEQAKAWHNWLTSGAGQKAISDWRVNGIQVFTPADGVAAGDATPPRT
jgi:tungstate transport system substrate-binding protein